MGKKLINAIQQYIALDDQLPSLISIKVTWHAAPDGRWAATKTSDQAHNERRYSAPSGGVDCQLLNWAENRHVMCTLIIIVIHIRVTTSSYLFIIT